MPAGLDIRLRVPTPGLLGLPWADRLADWDATEVPLRDIAVGPSRHLVRFVESDGGLWALKELPPRIAQKEFGVLRELESRGLAAVRPAGVVGQAFADTAILVTRFLQPSWQYRRLLMRLPPGAGNNIHRSRLLDAMAALLVDLHRNGVFWGDCSLANTLFSRDGQRLQAWMVDAETSEVHPRLSNGQRQMDLDIVVDNVAGGLIDVAARLGEAPSDYGTYLFEATSVVTRYQALWDIQHEEPLLPYAERYRVEGQIRRLNDLGFAVEEVQLESSRDGDDSLRLKVTVGGRRFHADQLRRLTGLDVGEGQATDLLNDLRAFQRRLEQSGAVATDAVAARRWLTEVFEPGMARAHAAIGGVGDPIQAYADLLEVRWLLSEQAGRDVGDSPALAALARREAPVASAARMAIAETPTGQLSAVAPVEEPPDSSPAPSTWDL
jgi:Domain of unknown function (DUF4032)/Lipopolysaccharide kinase (Kdo/WaaP) family